jgi:metal-dependent HD superfamily phosphatase/phosphodiesterase
MTRLSACETASVAKPGNAPEPAEPAPETGAGAQEPATGASVETGAEVGIEDAAGPGERGRLPRDAIAAAGEVRAPTRGNRRLEALLAAVNADPQVRAWWHMAQVNSERLGMSDHSWVHVQIVLNIALRVLRLLVRAGVEPAMVADHGMRARDAEVVVAAGALLHDIGMSIHRTDHEAFSLFLAERKLAELLADVYQEPERTVVVSEALHAIIGHRRRGEPFTVEAGVVRAADALDMAQGRSRLPVEAGQVGIHSISAAAIDGIDISAGEDRPVRVEVRMNNSAGIFQVDDLLATKLRGTPLSDQIEVVATIEGEAEKRLLGEFRLP